MCTPMADEQNSCHILKPLECIDIPGLAGVLRNFLPPILLVYPGIKRHSFDPESRRNGRNQGGLFPVDAVVLLADVLEVMLPVKRHHRLAILIQVQKTAPAADHRLGLGLWPVGDNALEALVHIVRPCVGFLRCKECGSCCHVAFRSRPGSFL